MMTHPNSQLQNWNCSCIKCFLFFIDKIKPEIISIDLLGKPSNKQKTNKLGIFAKQNYEYLTHKWSLQMFKRFVLQMQMHQNACIIRLHSIIFYFLNYIFQYCSIFNSFCNKRFLKYFLLILNLICSHCFLNIPAKL